MEGFVVSARKYRPDTFDTVVGQAHITNTLRNALRLNALAHAFLFSGPRGVGKTTCARILAKSINCENLSAEGDACNHCDSCSSFMEGRSMNIHELDAASNNSVEDIRKIIEQVRYVPAGGKKAVFIIDEVHMLSQAAFNAFLKTLEEPPRHAIFILATTEKHKILPTILSRCQKFDFRRIKVDDIAGHLQNICEKEAITFEYEALQLIALKADGALRDALSIFDQIVSFSNRNVTYKVVLENLNVLDHEYFFRTVDKMLEQDHTGLLVMLHEIVDLGFEPRDFLVGLNEHFRNLLVSATPETLKLLETSDNVRARYLEQSRSISPTLLLNAFNLASESEVKLRSSGNPRMLTELTLMKLAYLRDAIHLAAGSGDEKKKPLNEGGNPQVNAAAVPPPVTQGPPPLSPPLTPPVSPETPRAQVQTGAGPAPRIPAQNPTSPLPPIGIGIGLPNSLDKLHQYTPQEEKPALAEEAEDDFGVDTSVNIPDADFRKALEVLYTELEANHQMRLRMLLKSEYARLHHNQWFHQVPNEMSQRSLEIEKGPVVIRMRELLGQPRLRMIVEVDAEQAEEIARKVLTPQQKLEEMKKKNPDLNNFLKKFDANINWQ